MPENTAPRENLLVNLICNIAVPTYVLTSLSKEEHLGPLWGLVLAILFPVSYGVYDFMRRRRTNFISIIGFFSVLLTGVLGLLHVGGLGFAIKEAVMPTLIGIAILVSLRTKKPLVKELLYNEQVIDVARVNARVIGRNPGNFSTTITIDRGSGAGIAVGMPVVASSGALVGRIIESGPGYAVVRLVTDASFAVGVKSIGRVGAKVATGTAKGRVGADDLLVEDFEPVVFNDEGLTSIGHHWGSNFFS